MIQYQYPVRNNVAQVLRYTFRDQDGDIIDLTQFSIVMLEVKLDGVVYASEIADFVSPMTSGIVELDSYAFVGVGIWSAQFYVEDVDENRVYGEIIQVRVVPNVDDLALTELPVY